MSTTESAALNRTHTPYVMLISLILFALTATHAAAQDEFVERSDEAFYAPELNTSFRFQHIEGRQLGDTPSFTMAGATRFVDLIDGVLLFDGQARVTNDGKVGSSFGGVRRVMNGDSIFGAGIWLDVHQSPGDNTFQQLGTSLEWFKHEWSFRANGYFPIGKDQQTRAVGIRGSSGLRYQGNNIVFGSDIFRVDEVAMDGVELEVAHNISQYNAEAFAGYYYWQSSSEQTHGFKIGTRGYLSDNIAASLTAADDPMFGTSVFCSLTFFFGGASARPTEFSDKLRIPVERNHLVAIHERTVQTGSDLVVLTDPVSGLPILVEHLDSTATAGGDGTFESPLQSLDDLFASSSDGTTTNGNIAFAHSDSVFTGQAASLRDNQRFLGEGIAHTVATTELGTISLPAANGPGTVPLISGASGNAITLGSMGNEVSGFTIDGGTRAIVNDSGATGTNINRLTVQNTVGDGIVITPSTATTITDVIFSGVGGQDIVLNASDSTLTNITSTNAVGGSIFLQNLTGTTTLNNINITGAGGTGAILLDGAAAGAQVNLTDVDTEGGISGLVVENFLAGSMFAGTDVEITNPVGAGILLRDSAGSIQFDTATVTGAGGVGIGVSNTTGQVQFNTANVSNSSGPGIIVLAADDFRIGTGGTTAGDGGTIDSAIESGIAIVDSNVDIRFVNISNITTGVGPAPFDATPGDGIHFVQTTATTFNANFDNNVISSVADSGIDILLPNGSAQWVGTFTNNTINSNLDGILIRGDEFGSGLATLAIDNNTISTVAGAGITTSGDSGDFTIVSIRNNTVTGGQGGFHGSANIFDADPGTAGFQPVNAGTTVFGSSGNRLTGNGWLFDGPADGSLVFDELQIFGTGGSTALSYFNFADALDLTINSGVIDLTDGATFTNAINFNSNGGSLTLNNLNINLNNDPDPIAVRLQSLNGGIPVALSGTGNTTTGVTNFKQVTTGTGGGGFIGTIDFGGGNTLP